MNGQTSAKKGKEEGAREERRSIRFTLPKKTHRPWRKPHRVFTDRGEKRSRKPWEKAIHNHGDFSAVSWGKPAILGSVRRQFPDLCFLKAGA